MRMTSLSFYADFKLVVSSLDIFQIDFTEMQHIRVQISLGFAPPNYTYKTIMLYYVIQ